MRIPYYQVNAFTSDPFGGNPAGVCLLEKWPADALMQQIAAENDLSETAFVVPKGQSFDLRWFTPTVEVDLCGHATLATAYVLFNHSHIAGRVVPCPASAESITFQTRSGELKASRRGAMIELDFPTAAPVPCPIPNKLIAALGATPREVHFSKRDYLALFESEEQIAALQPDMALLAELDRSGIIVTARGKKADFVSRFFAPKEGISEDPVTGSTHCTLIPFWSERLGKTELIAHQISSRRGELFCRHLGERVGIAGTAVLYLSGSIEVNG